MQFGCQTGSSVAVVSLVAIFNSDFHLWLLSIVIGGCGYKDSIYISADFFNLITLAIKD